MKQFLKGKKGWDPEHTCTEDQTLVGRGSLFLSGIWVLVQSQETKTMIANISWVPIICWALCEMVLFHPHFTDKKAEVKDLK